MEDVEVSTIVLTAGHKEQTRKNNHAKEVEMD